LKIETLPTDDHQMTINVEIDQDQYDSAKRRAARKIAQRIKIAGFRPGKAPYDVVVRSAGEASVNEEAIDLLVDEIYPKILDETKIKPAAPGTLEEIPSLDPPKFKFLVPLAPVVDLGDYHSLRMPFEWQPPSEDKVDESIEEMRRMYAKTESVDRPIQSGDFVLIDLKGFNLKSETPDVPVIEKNSHAVFIRPDSKPDEWPYPGFSNELIGAPSGEAKKFTHKFPKDFTDENLQKLTIQFEATIKTIRGMTLPDLDEEFAKKAGNFDSIEAMREAIKTSLTNQSKADYEDGYFEKVFELIKAQASIKYPPQLVSHESEHVLEDLNRRLADQKMEFDAYLKMRNTDKDKFIEEEVKPVAIRRLERALIMDQVALDEKIEVSEETLNQSFQQTWADLQWNEDFQKYNKKNKPSNKFMESVAMESANRAMVKQTLARLKAIVTGEISAPPPDEKVAPEEAPKRKPRKAKPAEEPKIQEP